jgi:hypothetical protein
MQKNSDNFSMQEAMRLAKSDAGQQLMAMLQAQNSDSLKQAMVQASKGDFDKLKQTLAPLLASVEAQKLLSQLGRKTDE